MKKYLNKDLEELIMATKVNFNEKDEIGYIIFEEENPKHPCTLDYEVLAELNTIIEEIQTTKNYLRAIVIQSQSPKYFVVGANIKALQNLTSENISDWVINGHNIFNKLNDIKIPIIARVEGYALGGGLELAMASDMIFASEGAFFGQPEASLGVMPGWGGTFRLPQRIGFARANELFFTGRIITAKEACDIGLINRVVKKEEMDTLIDEVVNSIKKNDALAISYIKQIIYNNSNQQMLRNKFDEAATSSICMNSQGTKERLKNFFNSRKGK